MSKKIKILAALILTAVTSIAFAHGGEGSGGGYQYYNGNPGGYSFGFSVDGNSFSYRNAPRDRNYQYYGYENNRHHHRRHHRNEYFIPNYNPYGYRYHENQGIIITPVPNRHYHDND